MSTQTQALCIRHGTRIPERDGMAIQRTDRREPNPNTTIGVVCGECADEFLAWWDCDLRNEFEPVPWWKRLSSAYVRWVKWAEEKRRERKQ